MAVNWADGSTFIARIGTEIVAAFVFQAGAVVATQGAAVGVHGWLSLVYGRIRWGVRDVLKGDVKETSKCTGRLKTG